jgi:hypothetical protein
MIPSAKPSKEQLSAVLTGNKRNCPYCSVKRRTKVGLRQHIEQMHGSKITPGGILLP